jgi:hypothetical protein
VYTQITSWEGRIVPRTAQAPEQTIEQIRRLHPGEWLLIEVTKEEQWRPSHGRLIAHSPSREEIAKIDLTLPPDPDILIYVTHAEPMPKGPIFWYHG